MKISIAITTFALALAIVNHAHANDSDLDPAFGTGGIALTGLTDVYGGVSACGPVLQPDGKILMCGTRLGNGGAAPKFFVARFTAEGQLDPSFSFDGLATIDFSGTAGVYAAALALQADGRIVVVGTTSLDGSVGANNFAITRLTTVGELDTSFGTGTGKKIVAFDLDAGSGNDNAADVTIQPDGKIVVVGTVATAAHGTDFGVARLLGDGTLDSGFNLTGKATIGFDLGVGARQNDVAARVAIDSAGRIVIAGSAEKGSIGTDQDYAVARLLPNGTLDTDFNADGRATVAFDLGNSKADQVTGLALQANGKIVLSGAVDVSPSAMQNIDIGIVRLQPDGSTDGTFGIAGKTLITFDLIPDGTDFGYSIVVQPDGKLIVAGMAQSSGGSVALMARLLSGGTLDGSFGTIGRRTYDFGQTVPGNQAFFGVALSGSELIAGGIILVPGSAPSIDTFLVRLRNDTIFTDGFELIP